MADDARTEAHRGINADPLVDRLAALICDNAQPCYDCISGAGRTLKFLANAGRLLPDGGETRMEWAAAVTMIDGGIRYQLASNREHADLIVEGITSYVASLNEPTRQHNGVDSALVVNRAVRNFSDGSSWTDPWAEVTDATG